LPVNELRLMRPKPHEGSAEILGYKAKFLHWKVSQPKATLVCFHGWLDNAASFAPLAHELAEYEIIAWDFLGHGKSAHRHRGDRYHYIDLVSFIDAAVEKTKAAAEMVLVGHSMGAGAVALYAGSSGQKISKIVLIEGFAPMTANAGDAAKILTEGLRDFKKASLLPKPTYKNFDDLTKIRMRVNGLREDTAAVLVRRAAQKIKAGYTWRADFRLRAPSLVRLTIEQVENILASVKAEVLVILADKGMPQLRAFAAKNKNIFLKGRIEILAGHHHLHMDAAATVASSIRKFLA